MALNWHQRIDRAEKAGGFTAEDHNLADSWVTCACSEQDDGIERYDTGQPKDPELRHLGFRFYHAVEDGSFTTARATLTAIEQRAAVLLAEAAGGNDHAE